MLNLDKAKEKLEEIKNTRKEWLMGAQKDLERLERDAIKAQNALKRKNEHITELEQDIKTYEYIINLINSQTQGSLL